MFSFQSHLRFVQSIHKIIWRQKSTICHFKLATVL